MNDKISATTKSVNLLKTENTANVDQLTDIAALFGMQDTIGGELAVDYVARMVGKLRNENAALRDALLVRMSETYCDECDQSMITDEHDKTCRHYQTERKVIEGWQ